MSANNMDFDGFRAACEDAIFAYVRPYGLYHEGEVYWSDELPKKKGTVVRYFEDPTGPCMSLVVFDLDGRFLCNAYPPSFWEVSLEQARYAADRRKKALTVGSEWVFIRGDAGDPWECLEIRVVEARQSRSGAMFLKAECTQPHLIPRGVTARKVRRIWYEDLW